eukprot:UN33596
MKCLACCREPLTRDLKTDQLQEVFASLKHTWLSDFLELIFVASFVKIAINTKYQLVHYIEYEYFSENPGDYSNSVNNVSGRLTGFHDHTGDEVPDDEHVTPYNDTDQYGNTHLPIFSIICGLMVIYC